MKAINQSYSIREYQFTYIQMSNGYSSIFRALLQIQKNQAQFLSIIYSFTYFTEDFKCHIASFKYLSLYILDVTLLRDLVQEFDHLLKPLQQQLDQFIARRVKKIMILENLRASYYQFFFKKKQIDLNKYSYQSAQIQKISDYSIIKFSHKKQAKIPKTQQNYNSQQQYNQSPPLYQSLQPDYQQSSQQYSYQYTPNYTSYVPPQGLYQSQPPPAYWPGQDTSKFHYPPPEIITPDKFHQPLNLYYFDQYQNINNQITDSVFQKSISQPNSQQNDFSINQNQQKIDQPCNFQQPNEQNKQTEIIQQAPVLDDAQQASLLYSKQEIIQQHQVPESEIEKILLKKAKLNIEIIDSMTKQPIIIATRRFSKQESQIVTNKHDQQALQILENWQEKKLEQANKEERKKELQSFFDF